MFPYLVRGVFTRKIMRLCQSTVSLRKVFVKHFNKTRQILISCFGKNEKIFQARVNIGFPQAILIPQITFCISTSAQFLDYASITKRNRS